MANAAQLIAAVQSGDVAQVKSLLAADPSLASARDVQGVSAILHARYRNQAEVLALLLAVGPPLDIFEAAALGRLGRVRELLDRDPALLDSWSPDGFQPAPLAIFFQEGEAARYLIERGADLTQSSRNPMRVTALHAAAASQNVALVALVLERAADANARQQGGFTPLHEAAFRGNVEMAKLLLEYGADPGIKNDEGKSPADLAQENGHQAIVAVLEAAGKAAAKN